MVTTPKNLPVHGQDYSSALLLVDISGSSILGQENPSEEVKSVKLKFQDISNAVASVYNGEVLNGWQGDGGILWFYEPAQEVAKNALLAGVAILGLQKALTFQSDFTRPVGIKCGIHYGNITYDNNRGNIHSTDLDLTGHLKDKLYEGAMIITKEEWVQLPLYIKKLFTELGSFESTTLYIWKPALDNTKQSIESDLNLPGNPMEDKIACPRENKTDDVLERIYSLLSSSLDITIEKGVNKIDSLIQGGYPIGTKLSAKLFELVMNKELKIEIRAMSLNCIVRTEFWAPYKTFLSFWITDVQENHKQLSTQLTAFFAHPDNKLGFQYFVAFLVNLDKSKIKKHLIFDMLNVFRNVIYYWAELPDEPYLKAMKMIANHFIYYPEVQSIAKEIVDKIGKDSGDTIQNS